MFNFKLAFCALAIILLTTSNAISAIQQTAAPLKLEIIPHSTELLPGEPLRLTFVITNISSSPVQSRKLVVRRGDIKLLLSYNSKPYKQYIAGWILDGIDLGVTLKPKAKMTDEAVVHFNYAGRHPDDIETHYAFYGTGAYLLKAAFVYGVNQEEAIESEPIQIKVKAPIGPDAAVWDMIKDDPDTAYFLSVNGTTFVDGASSVDRIKKDRVTKMLKNILSRYPASIYSKYIESALSNHEIAIGHWKTGRMDTVERALIQAGNLLETGRSDDGIKMLKGAENIFQEVGIFPRDTPLELYIGLAYLMNKNNTKALEYLEPLALKMAADPENWVIIETVAFAHMAVGNEENARKLISKVGQEKDQKLILESFREQIKKGQPFSLLLYK